MGGVLVNICPATHVHVFVNEVVVKGVPATEYETKAFSAQFKVDVFIIPAIL